jgi:EmrB/QacA subfamily drug resistance transporter
MAGIVTEAVEPRKHSPRSTLRPGIILALVCGAQFMITLDIAIVNVALPSIQADLGLAPSDLQWVVITYGLMLGGLLLLGGRAGDLLGRRRMLLAGLALFAAASLTAGLANSFGLLVGSRAGQGVGAALMAPAALAILASTFAEGPERNKALGIFGAVSGSAASVGVVVSGALTAGPGWKWIFLINVPIGLVMLAMIVRYVPADERIHRGRADIAGAVAVTGGLMAIVYAINKSVEYGWTSATTLGFMAAGLIALALFVFVERRSPAPLMPLSMFRRRTLNAANLAAALVFAAFFATIFQASLFMQQVLGYSALRTGAAYLAIAGTAVVFAAGPAPRLLSRLGAGWVLAVGQSASAIGLLLLARVPADAAYWPDLFPGFMLLGGGIGLSLVAAQVAAFIGIPKAVSGLAGGMVETAREIGGSLGIAIVASVAIAGADNLVAAGTPAPTALTEGFHDGSLVAVGFSVAAALVAVLVLRRAERSASLDQTQPENEEITQWT